MAERQQVFRWVRDLLAAGLVALTVTTLTVSVIQDVDTISGANEGGSGECSIDLCASEADQVILNADSVALCTEGGEDPAKLYCSDVEACVVEGEQRLCAEQSRINLSAADDGADIDISADADITATAGNRLHVSAIDITMQPSSAFAVTAIDEVAIQSSGGGYIGTTTEGVQLVAGNAGDDITLSTLAGGDDIVLSSGDDLTLAADPTSGAFEATAGGASLLLNAAGVVLADGGGADTLTLNSGALQSTIVAGGLAYPLRGQVLSRTTSSFTPATTSAEVATTFTVPGGVLSSGTAIAIDVWGTAPGNVNNKTWQVRAHQTTCTTGTILATVNFSNAADTNWHFTAEIYHTGPSTQNTVSFARSQVNAGTVMLDSLATSAIDASLDWVLCVIAHNPTANTDSTMRYSTISFR